MNEKRASRPHYPESFEVAHRAEMTDPSPTIGSEAEEWPSLVPLLLEQTQLLRQLLAAQDRQNELLEELLTQVNAVQRQRQQELSQWKRANPHLARRCRKAAEILAQVQNEFLHSLTQEIHDQGEALLEGEFLMTELVDRFGPRMVHLNGLLQMLSQLSSTPNAPSTSPSP